MYFPGTSSSESLAFHSDKMGGKDPCRVTTGRIKARISETRQNIAIGTDSTMIHYLLRMTFLFVCSFVFSFRFSPSYSSVPAVHLITTVYISVVRTKECVYVREAAGE